MSEYQYYEFQAIDRPLTDEEQQAVARLSSRVHPHPRQAVFVYHWSDFPADPVEILAKYYDAMLYIANWGSRRLMFRFPQNALDLETAAAYCQPLIVQDYLSLSTVGEYTILNIEFHEEGGGNWIEGEGQLPAMLSLRNDILHSDYRALCLAWLKVLTVDDLLESVPEPPLPPGLKQLSPALLTFVEFLDIDEMLIQVAAEASGDRQAPPEGWLQKTLAQLPGEERDLFLLRLAQGEPHLSVDLNRRLRQIAPLPQPQTPPQRTVGQLLQMAETWREQEKMRRIAEAEAKRVRELNALAERESETWTQVFTLIEQMQSKPYDEAVSLLVKLRELARYRGNEAAFQEQINHIYSQYSRRSGLLRRLRDAGLYEFQGGSYSRALSSSSFNARSRRCSSRKRVTYACQMPSPKRRCSSCTRPSDSAAST
jgi:hypothetical protein